MGRRSERMVVIVEPRQEEFERKRGVTGIAVEDGLVHVEVMVAPEMRERLKVFRAIADSGTSLFSSSFIPTAFTFWCARKPFGRPKRCSKA